MEVPVGVARRHDRSRRARAARSRGRGARAELHRAPPRRLGADPVRRLARGPLAASARLGVVLFDRGRHGARPTAAGERGGRAGAPHPAAARRRSATRRAGAATGEAAGSAADRRLPQRGRARAARRAGPAHRPPPAARARGADRAGRRPRHGGRGGRRPGRPGHRDARRDRRRCRRGWSAACCFEEPYALVHPVGAADPRGAAAGGLDGELLVVHPPLVVGAGLDPAATGWTPGTTAWCCRWWRAAWAWRSCRSWRCWTRPAAVAVTDLGPRRPTRQVGYVTTPELARTLAVRALIRELRSTAPAVLPAAPWAASAAPGGAAAAAGGSITA